MYPTTFIYSAFKRALYFAGLLFLAACGHTDNHAPTILSECDANPNLLGCSNAASLIFSEIDPFTPYRFDVIDAGETATHVFTVVNRGREAAVNVTTPAATDAFKVVSNSCGGTISPFGLSGDTCTVAVNFTPPARGEYLGWVGIGFNSSSGPANSAQRLGGTAAVKWTWLNGSTRALQSGTYGAHTAAFGNTPGGRGFPAAWKDAQGKQWLFGGDSGAGGLRNDLWRFDPVQPFWAWVGGSSGANGAGTYGTLGNGTTTTAQPGARAASASWADTAGNLWLFGGKGYPASAVTTSLLNDLWKYSTSSAKWTWVAGANAGDRWGTYGTKNVTAATSAPGGRSGAVSWIDATGKLWLFGGNGRGSSATTGLLNDLWKFDPATLRWTWISGSNNTGTTGIYGTKGTPSAVNSPGSREKAAAWIDATGRLWLFGGNGMGATVATGSLNDLWCFDPAGATWTWISGTQAVNDAGVYGSLQAPAALGTPPALPPGRSAAVSWVDATGGLNLFGGLASVTNLDDTWRYDPVKGTWLWLAGHKLGEIYTGDYGALGVRSSAKFPGPRAGAAAWLDSTHSVWLFGGTGYGDSSEQLGPLNDLWKGAP